MENTWFHIDMDAFYASVEQLDNPELRGKPIIVGAPPGHRGVVSTCSYEARAFGVRSAMPSSQAARLCPSAIFVFPHFQRYHELSNAIMSIFSAYTPRLIQVSVDEAFLDMSGTRRLLGEADEVAREIKKRVLSEIGLTLSVGIAPNKFLAKIASAFKKPNGLTRVRPGEEESFVLGLPLDKVWGLGKKTLERLDLMRIETVADLKALEPESLRRRFGLAGGDFMWKAVRGIDPGIYEGESQSHSISSETTFEEDISSMESLDRSVFELCDHVMFRLLKEGMESRVIAIKVRYHDFTTISAQRTNSEAVVSIETFHSLCMKLLREKWDGNTPIRLIGVGLDKVGPSRQDQMELFDDKDQRRAKVQDAVLGIRDKFSSKAIGKASLLDRSNESE